MRSTNSKAAYSVVLPVFNEEKNVAAIVKRYAKIHAKQPLELIFVEDTGSTDNTRIELKKIAQKYSFVRPVFTTVRGYGASIYNGLKASTSEYICWTHADFQTDPEDTLKAFRLIQKHPRASQVVIKGRRYGRPLADRFFTAGMSMAETLYLGKPLVDINAQPNFFHRDFLKHLKNPPKDFSFDLFVYYLARHHGYEVVRFPVAFRKRLHGVSAWNLSIKDKWKFIKRTWKFSTELKKRLNEAGSAAPARRAPAGRRRRRRAAENES